MKKEVGWQRGEEGIGLLPVISGNIEPASVSQYPPVYCAFWKILAFYFPLLVENTPEDSEPHFFPPCSSPIQRITPSRAYSYSQSQKEQKIVKKKIYSL